MKKLFLNSAAAGMALALMAAPLAMAQQQMQNHSDDTHGGTPSHPTAQHMTPNHMAPTQHMTMAPAHEDHMAPMPANHDMGMQHTGDVQRQASYGHQWHQGDHYDGDRHVVNNWNSYHLRQPPAGYEWVQDGSQFVLIAVTSGIIADIIANSEQ